MADREQPPPASRRKQSTRSEAAATAGAPEEPSFDEALGRLEALVDRLEDGDLALEEALAGFEEGVRLSRRLADQLADAERRIERLTKEGGMLATRPLLDDEGSV